MGSIFLKIMHCEALSLKECIALIKQNFRPTQNNYAVCKQVIKDVGKSYYLQLNKPNVKLLIGGDKTNNTILIKIKNN
jgi:predicted ATP-dependent Lon-type protease